MRNTLIALLVFALVGCGTGGDDSSATSSSIVESPPVTLATTEPNTPDASTAVMTEAPPTTGAPITTPGERSITVGGMGSEYAEPVRCIIDIGVTSRRPTVAESSAAAAASGDALTQALLTSGVEPRDIQTSDFSVYGYSDNYEYNVISGYETHVGYRVAMPDVEGVGSVLAAAINAGGDDVRAWGIRFEADPTGLIDVAREQAWADAMQRAEALAGLANEPLGALLDAHEKVLVSTSQGVFQGGEGDSASFDIPVSPGVSGVIVLLTVTFAIGE